MEDATIRMGHNFLPEKVSEELVKSRNSGDEGWVWRSGGVNQLIDVRI